jgi:hypothetical protein
MTTPVLEKLTDVQSTVVDTISSVKEPFVRGVTVVVDFVVERAPQIPVLPFADQVPTPAELVTNQFKFAKSVLDANKDIALAVAKAAAPLTDQVLDRKHAKTVAKKATAEKAA